MFIIGFHDFDQNGLLRYRRAMLPRAREHDARRRRLRRVLRADGGEAVSETRINREERVALHPLSTRVHLAQIQSALVDVLDAVENHRAAAFALCRKRDWSGDLITGALPDAYVHVFKPSKADLG